MNQESHRNRHVFLHRSLDELIADFLRHGGGDLSLPLSRLMAWSHAQTIEPCPGKTAAGESCHAAAVPPEPAKTDEEWIERLIDG